MTPDEAHVLLALARARVLAGTEMATVAVDDRFELDWLREQLACAES